VGHSLGSVTSIVTEGRYHDADALVVTGQAITPHPLPFDSDTLDNMLSGPYGFVKPDARATYFYWAPGADPDVIDYDNTYIMDYVPRGEITSALPLLTDPSLSSVQDITEPVLVQLGDQDLYAPGSLAPYEAAYYSSAASMTVQVLQDIGHDFNLHLNNTVGWAQIDAWLGSVL
jgi:pimeloyl-ACP methyl ester carboxylesterase